MGADERDEPLLPHQGEGGRVDTRRRGGADAPPRDGSPGGRPFPDSTTRLHDNPSPKEAHDAEGRSVREGADWSGSHRQSSGLRCGVRRCRRRVESSGATTRRRWRGGKAKETSHAEFAEDAEHLRGTIVTRWNCSRSRRGLTIGITLRYDSAVNAKPDRKPVVRLCREEMKTPPMTSAARIEAGTLLRWLQEGRSFGMPHLRHMPSIGRRCVELRVNDETKTWRIVCRPDADAVVFVYLFEKKTEKTPAEVKALCRARLAAYDAARKGT